MEQLITEDPTRIGPYRLIARLGEGGMGLVYLGRSEAGRTVAVKVVQAEHAQHPEFRQRFAREVAAARRVGGDWTAAVLDADTDAPVPWVATQYIPGPDLTTVVARDFGPLPEHSVRTLAHRLATALGSVHGAGLIHRDLKPSNVLVTVDGPRVIDFGIARAMDGLAGDSLRTRTGMLIGSPGFMSPEQVRGLELTPASDVFCLGAVLVYAATGRLLFGASDSSLHAHLFRIAEEEPDLTGVPDALVDLVRACLDKDPARRPTPADVAARTVTDRAEEWLPGSVLAQLGRHAARLLDFTPETRVPLEATPAPQDPRIPSQPRPLPQPPPAYTPTTPVDHSPPGGFGPAVGPVPGNWGAPPSFPPDVPGASPKRWWGLVAALPAQLLVAVGSSAMYVALPAAQADLGAGVGVLRTMLLAQALSFGALLLLGGHVADLLGRRRTLLVGLAGAALSAVAGGSASATALLVAAQILMGISAALVSAAALALVAGGFTAPGERGRAFGAYAVIAGGGLVIGDYAGGWLAEGLGWRWCFYGTVPLAALAAALASGVADDRRGRAPVRFDGAGVLLGTGGLAALGYGLDAAGATDGSGGWARPLTLLLLVSGAALLGAFAWWQTRAADPLVPRLLLGDRRRLGALLALTLSGVATSTLFLVLYRYLTGALDIATPARVSLALLPVAGALLVVSTQVAARLQHRLAPGHLIAPGLLLAAVGTALLTRLERDSSYTGLVLPALLLVGLGLGLALSPLLDTATGAAPAGKAGGTAAVVLTLQNLGGLLAAPLLGVLLPTVISARLAGVSDVPQGLREPLENGYLLRPHDFPAELAEAVERAEPAVLAGYSVALWCAAGLLVLAGLLAGVLIGSKDPDPMASPR
ncbi:bifunctional serine/threonine protein kinase/MFS transporter [Streptomyces sp. NPDC051180]|uniref:bifunctional serine/threonine protein kinase/MFS transporter n=1 Tax=Streptomyces sp. NPDC051180 TaxID=3155797 RepID=UPI00344D9B0B